jgi:hypothetical protein
MEAAELENIGTELCQSLLNQNYASIAQRFGYAIAFKKSPATAIKEDFEHSVIESGGVLENSKFNVTVKVFPKGTPGFINLIECRFVFANSDKEVLAEIIENEAGFYLEQISCVA